MKTIAKLLLVDSNHRILVLYRSSSHPNFARQPDLPGGELNKGEEAEAAVTRELKEETGLHLSKVKPKLGYKKQISSDTVHLIFLADIGTDKPEVDLSWEHGKFEWLTTDQIKEKIEVIQRDVDPYLKTVLEYLA